MLTSTLFGYFLIPLIIALFLAITMGGSGTGPSFSAAYGANVVRKSVIPGLFGIMVFLGALVAGKETAITVGKGLLNPDMMTLTLVSIILFSVSISLLIANISGIPQSTSQSTVLAVMAAVTYFGQGNPQKLFTEIIPAWFILPVLSYFISYLMGKYIYRPMRRRGLTISRSSNVNRKPVLNAVILFMSLYVAFSIGANNVANAAGPIATMTANELGVNDEKGFKILLLVSVFMMAPAFGIGSSIFGNKILKNTGKEIVLFGKFEAIIIAFVSASLLLLASVIKGIPSSLVQLNVAAILGIGVAKLGPRNIFLKTEVRKFFLMWLIAPIISYLLCLALIAIADYYNFF
jgi:sulfate permease